MKAPKFIREYLANRYFNTIDHLLFLVEQRMQYKHPWGMNAAKDACVALTRRKFNLPDTWQPQ